MPKEREEERSNTWIMEKWICNASKRELAQKERSVLWGGLNFAITPKKNHPIRGLQTSKRISMRKKTPGQGQKAALCNEIAGILKTARPPPSNITKKGSKSRENIWIKNKTRTWQTSRRITAEPQSLRIPKNTKNKWKECWNTFLAILEKDPTVEEKKRKLEALVKPWLNENKMEKQTYNQQIPTVDVRSQNVRCTENSFFSMNLEFLSVSSLFQPHAALNLGFGVALGLLSAVIKRNY